MILHTPPLTIQQADGGFTRGKFCCSAVVLYCMPSIGGRWRRLIRRRGHFRWRCGFVFGEVLGHLGPDRHGLLCLVHNPPSAAHEKHSTSNRVARLVRSWEPRADVPAEW